MSSCADCRDNGRRAVAYCSCCGVALMPSRASAARRLRASLVSLCLILISVWTGVAGGVGFYARQVGPVRAWGSVVVALATIESGKLASLHLPPPAPRVGRRR